MKVAAASIQMHCEPMSVAANVERADTFLRQAKDQGVELAVLPETFNTGYGKQPDYRPYAETVDGPTFRLLRERSRSWKMGIAAGFVETDGRHLYDSLGFCRPDGAVFVYRKRNLVFWERFRFYPGRDPLIVSTPWGRIGFAICADMIYKRVWNSYRGRIDLAVVSAAWPDFACQNTGRKHWLLGYLGGLTREIPQMVARDLGIPVIFANQCGETRTTIPLLHLRIADRFAGQSSITDGLHGTSVRAGTNEELLISPITLHPPRGPHSCRTTSPSVTADWSSAPVQS